ncbi:MAG: glycosyl hydrolase [Flavobacteriaceae bacterium]|nr:glycosyl hydrolase [Flavobacteriaceae bacterium]
MNRVLKSSIKVISIILVLFIITALSAYFYFSSNVLTFETTYSDENFDLQEITIKGRKYIDRNGNNKLDLYEDHRQTIGTRVEDLLPRLTIEEKIRLLKGSGMSSAIGIGDNLVPGAAGTTVGIPRLGIPRLILSDGPAGLRIHSVRENDDKKYYCTAFPIGTLLASTWNKELVNEVGRAMGSEALDYGVDLILGPGVNIHRHPLCGRNFEYYSEDPILTGEIGASMINGIESNGVGATPKHFVANNQETSRNINNSIVSDRAMREIYLKGFEIIVKKSQPWAIMSSYNKVNGVYTSESKPLLTDILRDEWGYEGIVMTDWFGGNNPSEQIKAGNDLLEPGTKNIWDDLTKAYEDGDLSLKEIDLSVSRILGLIIKSKKMSNYDFTNEPDLDKNALITRRSASEGMVLLKNEATLPFKNIKNIALMGSTSFNFIAGGTGSGDVEEAYTVSLEDALLESGYEINKLSKETFELHLKENEEAFEKKNPLFAMLDPSLPPEIDYPIKLIKEFAKTSDLAIITIGRNSGETSDRLEKDDFLLSKKESQMIKNTCEIFHSLGKKVLIVLNVGGVIETASWNDLPDAILVAWQAGQESGNSVVDIISGVVNPSGKLPMTFPVNLSDHGSAKNFPSGIKATMTDFLMASIIGSSEEKPKQEQTKNIDYTIYEEGVYVGYRHFDKKEIDVSYPFGYGLSYTEFDYSDLKIKEEENVIKVTVKITNIGSFPGKEVIQIYTSKPDSNIDRPIKELRSFEKTSNIQVGESINLNFNIPISELSYWSVENSSWEIEKGVYDILVGSSSRDIELIGQVYIN